MLAPRGSEDSNPGLIPENPLGVAESSPGCSAVQPGDESGVPCPGLPGHAN